LQICSCTEKKLNKLTKYYETLHCISKTIFYSLIFLCLQFCWAHAVPHCSKYIHVRPDRRQPVCEVSLVLACCCPPFHVCYSGEWIWKFSIQVAVFKMMRNKWMTSYWREILRKTYGNIKQNTVAMDDNLQFGDSSRRPLSWTQWIS